MKNHILSPLENAKTNVEQIERWLKNPAIKSLIPSLHSDMVHWKAEIKRLSENMPKYNNIKTRCFIILIYNAVYCRLFRANFLESYNDSHSLVKATKPWVKKHFTNYKILCFYNPRKSKEENLKKAFQILEAAWIEKQRKLNSKTLPIGRIKI